MAIASRALSKYEKNYKPYKLESLAIMYGLEQFRHLLYGRHFHLHTDHRALVYMFENRLHSTLANWLHIQLEFDFTVSHIPGVQNVLPDALSRLYARSNTWGVDDVSVTQSSTDAHRSLGGDVMHDTPQLPSMNAMHSIRARPEMSQEEMSEMLKLIGKTMPEESQRKGLVARAHSQGHFSEKVVVDLIYHTWNYWWPTLRKDVLDSVSRCTQCQRYNIGKYGYHPLRSPTAMLPGDWWQMDLIELDTSTNGYNYVLCVVDLFSSYLVTRPLKTRTAEETAQALLALIADWGPPKILQADDGGEFDNEVLKELTKLAGVDFHISTPKNKNATGRVERLIRTISLSLRKMLDGMMAVWDTVLPLYLIL